MYRKYFPTPQKKPLCLPFATNSTNNTKEYLYKHPPPPPMLGGSHIEN